MLILPLKYYRQLATDQVNTQVQFLSLSAVKTHAFYCLAVKTCCVGKECTNN